MTPDPIYLWGPVVACMAAIFYLSSLPVAPLPRGVADWAAHLAAYLGLAVLVVRALAGGLPRRIGIRVVVTAILVTVLYGISDEVHQAFVPGRSAEASDLIADSAGAIGGAIACWAWGIIAASDAHTRGSRHR